MARVRNYSFRNDLLKIKERYFRLKSLGWQDQEIVKELGYGRSTLYEWMKRWGDELSLSLPENIIRFIECSLPGDGSIIPKGEKCIFSLTTSNSEYRDWIERSLMDLGLKCQKSGHFLWKKEDSGFNKDCDIYWVKTRGLFALNYVRSVWYPNNIKEIPGDFKWDYEAFQRIYIEDGSRSSNGINIYWGVKSDEGFERMLEAARTLFGIDQCRELKKTQTAGRKLKIDQFLFSLPGYEYKGDNVYIDLSGVEVIVNQIADEEFEK